MAIQSDGEAGAQPAASDSAMTRVTLHIVEKTFFVYILSSRNRAIYVGVTSDLPKRLQEHLDGTASSFTSKYRITRLVYAEEVPTADEAIAREKQLKGWSRKKKIALIEQANPTWLDLTTV